MNGLELRDKKVLVVGLARSGLAAANFLIQMGARVTVSDLKGRGELAPEIAQLDGPVRLSLGSHAIDDFLQSDLVVLSPGVPSSTEPVQAALAACVPVWSEVELAYRFLKGRIVGITGSNGKTTTTALLGEMFRASGEAYSLAGNIGKPLIQAVAESGGADRTYVVELSSFQLENIHRFRCNAAVLLNITPDHLDRYPNFSAYLSAKQRIFLNQSESDFAILNADDPETARLSDQPPAQCARFSRTRRLDEGACVEGSDLTVSWKGRRSTILPAHEIRLKGMHNLENALAAALTGTLSGLPASCIAEALRTFSGVEHRLEFVARIRGIDFYNDSKATNVDSAARAVASFTQPIVLIMGGLDKGGDFTLLKMLLRGRVKRLLLIGSAGPKIDEALRDSVPTMRVDSLEKAVAEAFQCSIRGDVVLLSPACASFDMFENYEHRGRVFKSAVRQLKKQVGEPVK